jgi:hypothetical protein
MSSRGVSKRAPEKVRRGTGEGPAADNVVQELLAERRELLVANERLRLELEEAVAGSGRNPRVRELEAEVRRLRHELEVTRAERDELRDGMGSIMDRLRQPR